MEKVTNQMGLSGWLWRWKAFGMTFAVACGCGVKAKWPKGCNKARAINGQRKTNQQANAHKKKERIYEEQNHRCWLCHKETKQGKLQMHHILPLYIFPEMGAARENLMLVCEECHRHIHQNPLLAYTLIRETAKKLGVTDLKERFGKWLEKKTEKEQ